MRRSIDRQRVQLWYGWLHHHSSGTSAYALEKQLLPEGFAHASDGTVSHRNRMSRYRDGKHVPRRDLVARAEMLFPGGQALLDHPYWEILDPDRALFINAGPWLARLGADVQRLMLKSGRAIGDHRAQRRTTTSISLRQMENLGTLDALAATALLLREALQIGNASRALYCASSFWRLLLLIGSSVPFVELLPAMAELADEALLHQVVYQGKQVTLASVPIRRYESLLSDYCLDLEDAGKLRPDHDSWTRARLLLIRGMKGHDFLHAFRVPVVATPALRADPEKYARFLRDQIVCRMAFGYCGSTRWANRNFEGDLWTFYNDPEGRWPTIDSPPSE